MGLELRREVPFQRSQQGFIDDVPALAKIPWLRVLVGQLHIQGLHNLLSCSAFDVFYGFILLKVFESGQQWNHLLFLWFPDLSELGIRSMVVYWNKLSLLKLRLRAMRIHDHVGVTN